jgi:tricorn protease
MKRYIFSVLLVLGLLPVIAQTQTIDRLFRFPAIHQNTVVFTYAGDLYSVDIKGGVAHRLTSDKGFEMFAKISPDGKTIAFTGQYDGNTEVYVMPVEGGKPRRLTYTATLHRDDVTDRMGPNNIVMAWSPDGKYIIYRSRKQSFNSFVGQLFKVPAEGGMSEEIPLSTGGFCSFSSDGSKLAFNRVFREFRTWKYYHGGMADDVRIYDFNTGKVTKITDNTAQDIFPMWHGNTIYFLSDRDRIMNLFSYDLESQKTLKLTQFDDYDIKFPSIGKDKIIFEKGGFLFVFNTLDQKVTKLNITIDNDLRWGRDRYVDASKSIRSISLSPKGSRMAVSARGEIFNVPTEEGVTYNLTKSSGAHDRNAVWSPDGKHIAWLSDKSGEYEIYMTGVNPDDEPVQITNGQATYKFALSWSPDSKYILWSDKNMDLWYVDVETFRTVKAAHSKTWEIRDYAWSPDSRYIAFSDNDGDGLQKIFIYNLETKETTPVTSGWYSASRPHFSHDGKYLFFVSDRNFSPVYSATEWNVAYRNMSSVFMILLSNDTPNPFGLKDITDDEETADGKDDDTDVNVKIDFENIDSRIIGLPVEAGNYWNINYVDGRLYYNFYKYGRNGSSLKMYDFSDKTEKELGKNTGYRITTDRKKMLISSGQKMQLISLPRSGPLKINKPVDLSDMKVWVNVHEEWTQIYNEAWRQMRDFFYDPNMHGVDWQAMRDKYGVLVPYVNHRNDLSYLIGELIGELNIGHAYIGGGDRPQPDRIPMGLLGAKISRDASGYFKIDKILKGENFRKELRSPLTEPGLNVKEGDFIVAVDGVSAKDYQDIYEALRGKAGKTVSLKINGSASEDGARTIVVKPIADEAKLYYYNWVQNNIRKVNEATNGEVGYIHIPDMGPEGLNEFMKHFYPQLTKKALIIDDRGNGGGNVSPMLIERLRREITRANIARNQTIPGQTPKQMMVGPTVLLINQYSASDGDLFPYSYKIHNLGTVIGVRSWGGVTGIRGSLPFIDGADLRKPEFSTYAADGKNWIIEGWGVEPDIVVDNDPAKEYSGEDQQLEKAIEVIKKQLKDYKPVPPPPPYPDKSK